MKLVKRKPVYETEIRKGGRVIAVSEENTLAYGACVTPHMQRCLTNKTPMLVNENPRPHVSARGVTIVLADGWYWNILDLKPCD